MKYIHFFIPILFISFLSCGTSKETKNIQKSFLNAPFKEYLNKDHLIKSRELISNSLNKSILDNDSIIFIEMFNEINISYRCFIYTSTDNSLQKAVIFNTNSLHNSKKDILQNEDVSEHSNKRLIDYFKQNNLDKIKEIGDKAWSTPSTDMIITMIRKVDNKRTVDYIITQYDPSKF